MVAIDGHELCERVLRLRRLEGRSIRTSEDAQRLVLAGLPLDVRSSAHYGEPRPLVFSLDPPRELLRIVSVSSELSTGARALPPTISLPGIGRYAVTPVADARTTSYAELARGLDAKPQRRIDLLALSPTRLGVGGERPLPLPVPWLLLAEPAKCWRAFCPSPAPPARGDLEAWQQRHVTISHHEIHTEVIRVEGQEEPGFVGRFDLVVSRGHERDPEWAWTGVLADYAEFTGVGRRRARGAGQLRRLA